MNWRWIVPGLLIFGLIEVLMGIAAYGSNTWNLSHTEVLTGWAAVREVCLVFMPLFFGPVLVFGALIWLALVWASGGRRG